MKQHLLKEPISYENRIIYILKKSYVITYMYKNYLMIVSSPRYFKNYVLRLKKKKIL